MSDARAAQIAAELRKSEPLRLRGNVFLMTATAILAAIPGLGPAAVVADKLGSKLLDGDLEQKLQELCDVVAVLEPNLERIHELDDQVAVLSGLLARNPTLTGLATGIARTLVEQMPEFRVATTNGSSQTFTDVMIRGMRLISEARSESRNTYQGTHVSGDALFMADGRSHQDVSGSTFSAPGGGSIRLDGTRLRGGVHVKPSPPREGQSLKSGDEIGSVSFVADSSLRRSGDVVGSIEFVGNGDRQIAAISVTTLRSPAPRAGSGFWVERLSKN